MIHVHVFYRAGTKVLTFSTFTNKYNLKIQWIPSEKATRPFQAQQGKPNTLFIKQRNCSKSRATEITEQIADMIVLDLKPLASVEWF